MASANKHRASLNLYDMPEMLPGAQPSANPAQRERFEVRCKQLHEEDEADRQAEAAEVEAAAGAGQARHFSELEAMFPNLDAALVRAIRADAASAQSAIELLLQLSAAAACDGCDSAEAVAAAHRELPPFEVGVEDHQKFPTLTDAGGWQVATEKQFERAGVEEEKEDAGCDWRDRAKAAADIPAPTKAAGAAPTAWGAAAQRRRARDTDQRKDEDEEELSRPLTDYEFRQQAGQRRAKHRAQFAKKKGVARGIEQGARGHVPAVVASDSESEATDDDVHVGY